MAPLVPSLPAGGDDVPGRDARPPDQLPHQLEADAARAARYEDAPGQEDHPLLSLNNSRKFY